MSYAAILVHVGEDAHADARVKLAASLADRFNAKLIGLAAEDEQPLTVTDGLVLNGEMAERAHQEIVDRLAAKEQAFRKAVPATKQPPQWRAAVGNPVMVLAAEMRAADLAILGREPSSTDTFRALYPATALLRLGRPALLVPNGVSTLEAKNVVIGWKDSRECRRAVRDALPLLHDAECVRVVEICENEQQDHARARIEDVVHYLAQHRLKAQSEVICRTKSTPTEELIRVAQRDGADLIVSGAYGHSRFGEWVFGGMTSDLLATCPISCLMSH